MQKTPTGQRPTSKPNFSRAERALECSDASGPQHGFDVTNYRNE